MNSPTHRANILNSHFTEIGVGIAEGIYEGQPTVFVVQLFGAPAAPKAQFPAFLTASTTPKTASSTPATAPATTSPVAVKGASLEEETPAPKVIMQDETFIAVKNEVATNSPAAAVVSPDASEMLVQKLVTSPKSVVETIYLVLAVIIGIALIIMIVVEVRHQHPKNAALGVLLILLMVALLYLGQYLTPATLSVL